MIKRIILCILIINPNITLSAETSDTLNLGIKIYGSKTEYLSDNCCTIDTQKATFNLTLTDIPVGEASSLYVSTKSDCISNEGIVCADVSIPEITITCNFSSNDIVTALIDVTEDEFSLLDTTNKHTLSIYKIGSLNHIVELTNKTTTRYFNIYAKFDFPSTLYAGTTYTWNSELTGAVTIDFL